MSRVCPERLFHFLISTAKIQVSTEKNKKKMFFFLLNTLFKKKDGEYCSPMCEGTEQNKDVPDGMIVRTVVVGKKVSTCGIGYSFR